MGVLGGVSAVGGVKNAILKVYVLGIMVPCSLCGIF